MARFRVRAHLPTVCLLGGVGLLALALLLGLGLFASPARGARGQHVEAYYEAPVSPVTPASLSGPLGVVTSVDAWRGVPTFVFFPPGLNGGASTGAGTGTGTSTGTGTGTSTGTGTGTGASAGTGAWQASPPLVALGFEGLAWHHLRRLAHLYHLDTSALAATRVHRVMDPGRGGVLVAFRQTVGGLPVVENELKVLFGPGGNLVAMSGRLHPGARQGVSPGAFAWKPEDALAEALADRLEGSLSPAALVPVGAPLGGYRRYALAAAGGGPGSWVLIQPAVVRPVLYPMPSRLVPAYEVEFLARDAGPDGPGAPQAWRLILDAAGGEILQRRYLTFEVAYRVWADQDGLYPPMDGPLETVAPHPTGVPDEYRPGWTSPILVEMEGFNEGPEGTPDPWLPPGETRTRGNNAQVFVDLVSPDGFNSGDLWGQTSQPGVFDYVYDASLVPFANQDQLHAGAVQAFYTVNWLHDYFYDSGFDEVAGNAQTSNYGRGGVEGDPLIVQVEGKAEGFQNNASMSPLGDGASPFMLNGLWQASPVLLVEGDRVRARGAFFGASAYDVAGPLVLIEDNAAPVTDGCSAPVVPLAGAVVLIDRGTCTFASKAERAQVAGALAVIIANNRVGESPQEMPNTDPPLPITIPVVSITMEDGQALKTRLQGGPVSVTLSRDGEIRQGALDSGVVAHEWGHYMHMRLVSCGNAQCYAMSEGFADFVAGFMTIREGADLMGTYATGVYSVWHLPNAAYYGVRRVPYSADLTKNALYYRHVADGVPLPDTHPMDVNSAPNSEVHNAGEIWGTVMHDLYMALLGDTLLPTPRLTFAQAQRRMADLLVLGMALAPQDPTFTEQRDALLAAALAADPADFALFANAFARRGLGTCALSPVRDSVSFVDLEESFDLSPNLRLESVSLDDAVVSCDQDGILDAGEVGHVVITLRNTGTGLLVGAIATVQTSSPEVTFPGGQSATFPPIAPFDLGEALVEIALSESVSERIFIPLEVTVSHGESCVPQTALSSLKPAHYDELLAASQVDNVESERTVWVPGGTHAGVWERRNQDGPEGNHFWHGDALGTVADVWLGSPPLEVSADAPLLVTIRHRHRFEESNNTFWDGGVIELSLDDGDTWEDISLYADLDPMYGGTLTSQSNNPLGNRQAFVGDSAGFPAWETLSLDLGMALAGETIRLRFRVGTDQAMADYGWDLDDIAFEGLSNTPFPLLTENYRSCDHPFAQAGPDQVVLPGSLVALDGTASYDPQGDPLTFLWTQVSGEAVTLSGATTATPSFTAPMASEPTPLVFELLVSDGQLEDTDQVTITVDPNATTTGDGGLDPDGGEKRPIPGRGCGCNAGAADNAGAAGNANPGGSNGASPAAREAARAPAALAALAALNHGFTALAFLCLGLLLFFRLRYKRRQYRLRH